MLTAGHDPLRDEGLHYAQKLTEAGNEGHAGLLRAADARLRLLGKVIDEANVAVQLCAAQLRGALA